MKQRCLTPILFLAACGAGPRATTQAEPGESILRESHAIAMPGVEGRIDHLAFDAKRMRLYVAALANGTLEVLDLEQRVRERRIEDLSEPQGVLYLSGPDCIVVSEGGRGRLDVFDAATLERRHTVDVGSDADNLRFDAATGTVFVAAGDGAIVSVDSATWTVGRRWPLPAHPESFQLSGDGKRIFANVPGAGAIAVIDRTQDSAPQLWPVKDAAANYPMALLEADGVLLVGCRNPPRLLEIDAASGEARHSFELSGDCDDIFLDSRRGSVFVSCGAGSIDVFDRRAPEGMRREASIPGAAGARTCLWVPELQRLFLAVPHRGDQRAEVRVLDTK